VSGNRRVSNDNPPNRNSCDHYKQCKQERENEILHSGSPWEKMHTGSQRTGIVESLSPYGTNVKTFLHTFPRRNAGHFVTAHCLVGWMVESSSFLLPYLPLPF
jgi:hypothetical protein